MNVYKSTYRVKYLSTYHISYFFLLYIFLYTLIYGTNIITVNIYNIGRPLSSSETHNCKIRIKLKKSFGTTLGGPPLETQLEAKKTPLETFGLFEQFIIFQ